MKNTNLITYAVVGAFLLGLGAIAFMVYRPSKVTLHNELDVSVCVNWPLDYNLKVAPKSRASKTFMPRGDGSFAVYECDTREYLGSFGYFTQNLRDTHVINVPNDLIKQNTQTE